jgi:hypothetical protein
MRRALLVLDVLLVALAVYLATQVAHAWRTHGLTRPIESARPAAPEPAPVTMPVPAAAGPAPAVIAERNLFSPSRSETVPEPRRAVGPPATPPPPRPRLYGVVLLPDGRSRAFIEDVQRRRVFGYSVGEAVAGSRVERIEADRVVLSRGSETYEVLLRDPSKPRPRPSAAVAPTPGRALPPGIVPGAAPVVTPPGNPAGEEDAETPVAPVRPRVPARPGRVPLGGTRLPAPPGMVPGPAVPAPPGMVPGPAAPAPPAAAAPVPSAPPTADEEDDS